MGKLIIKFDDDLEWDEIFHYASGVIEEGRISYNKKGKQFCFYTTFGNSVGVSAFKPSANTDTLVIRKAKPTKDKGE